jgi:dTDP-4-dehydrorhamnose reductase
MKILVLGASGMAGHVVALSLQRKGYDITRVSGTRKTTQDTILLDLTDLALLNEYLSQTYFDVIINCAGLLVAQAEKKKNNAVYLNAFLPRHLEARFAGTKTKVIHLSTDCVFSGEHGPYYEVSSYDGTLFYDRCKALGEIDNDKDLTFRMSIIGPELRADGIGLFNWFIKQSGSISGFSNVIWNGITTVELGKAIDEAIKQKLTGLYHLTPKKSISKHDLLVEIQKAYPEIKVNIRPTEVVPSNKALINTRTDFQYTVPTYAKMISEMRQWSEDWSSIYPHYSLNKKE